MNSNYRQMLKRMWDKEKRAARKRREAWFLYILKCNDGSLYTGITKNVEKRLEMHAAGKAARYTRTRLPLELLYQESCKSRTDALMRESYIKSLTKSKKLALVNSGKE